MTVIEKGVVLPCFRTWNSTVLSIKIAYTTFIILWRAVYPSSLTEVKIVLQGWHYFLNIYFPFKTFKIGRLIKYIFFMNCVVRLCLVQVDYITYFGTIFSCGGMYTYQFSPFMHNISDHWIISYLLVRSLSLISMNFFLMNLWLCLSKYMAALSYFIEKLMWYQMLMWIHKK